MQAHTPSVLYDSSNHVVTLTINRPEKRNALSGQVIRGLRAGIAKARADGEGRVIVITGAGNRSFCAGGDLDEMIAGSQVYEAAHDSRGQLASLFSDMWSCGIPTIAAVKGYALAGGFGLAMACDFVFASTTAKLGVPEVNVGLWPYMITVPMLRSMPPKVALELMVTGRLINAGEADELGLLYRLCSQSTIDDEVAELAQTIASKPASAIQLGRTAFYQAMDQPSPGALHALQLALTVATSTADAAEGVLAFQEKRVPRWRD